MRNQIGFERGPVGARSVLAPLPWELRPNASDAAVEGQALQR